MPPPEAMSPSQLPEYYKVRDEVKAILDGIQIKSPSTEEAVVTDLFHS